MSPRYVAYIQSGMGPYSEIVSPCGNKGGKCCGGGGRGNNGRRYWDSRTTTSGTNTYIAHLLIQTSKASFSYRAACFLCEAFPSCISICSNSQLNYVFESFQNLHHCCFHDASKAIYPHDVHPLFANSLYNGVLGFQSPKGSMESR